MHNLLPSVLAVIAVSVSLSLASDPAQAATGFLKSERTQGLSKVCFYDVLGALHTLNLSSTQLCPLTSEFDIIPNAPQQPSQSTPTRTGFLKSERTQGLSKVCFYDVLGETQAITIGSTQLCPLNYRFR